MTNIPLQPSDATLPCPQGGGDCVYVEEVVALRAEVALLREQVRTDALTGLFNFRYLRELLPMEMERTRRSGQSLSLILLDIDHFKKFNDDWGHEVGNQALVHVARLINLAVRCLDFSCRFGGEEFVVLLPNTDLAQATTVSERLRTMISASPLSVEETSVFLTASLGVDEFKPQHGDSPEQLLKRADAWLYEAKRQGRNRVAHPDLIQASAAVNAEEKDALAKIWSEPE